MCSRRHKRCETRSSATDKVLLGHIAECIERIRTIAVFRNVVAHDYLAVDQTVV